MDILSDVIRNLYVQYGPNLIADGNEVRRRFLEQAPDARHEAQLLDAFLRVGGNAELLKVLNADRQTQIQCRSWLIGTLQTRLQMPPQEAAQVVASFWNGLTVSAVPPKRNEAIKDPLPGFEPPGSNPGKKSGKTGGKSSGAFLAVCALVLLIAAGAVGFLIFRMLKGNAGPDSGPQYAGPAEIREDTTAAPADTQPAEHTHIWAAATCTAAKHCEECGETEGEPLGHTWVPATYTSPKTCTVCGAAEGGVLIEYHPGDIYYMGTYPQNSTSSSQREPIAWLVLEFDPQNNRILVISQYCLDTIPFDDMGADGIWETCTLRSWLNQDFLTTAFAPAEQERILYTTVDVTTNPTSKRSSETVTEDRIFLLSYDEAMYYFSSDPARQGTPTTYCRAHGCYDPVEYARAHGKPVVPEEVGHTWWWLRTPGMDDTRTCNVVSKGTPSTYGGEFFSTQGTIRPVMWIQLG